MYILRQADRFYDGDMFIDPAELDREANTTGGIENSSVIQNHPIRSRDNLYEFRDTPMTGKLQSKSLQDTHSIRSPSSLAMTTTQTTRSGSQNSLRSAISLKESVITTPSKDAAAFDKSQKYSERSVVETNPKGKYDDSRNLLTTYDKSRDTISSVASSEPKTSTTTPVPSTRKSLKSSRTHLIEGIPQTEV